MQIETHSYFITSANILLTYHSTDPNWPHWIGAVPAVRRQGDHQWLQRLHRPRVGRQHRRDGQYPHPPLRGGAALAL